MRIESDEERRFYEIESQKQNWSVRQLCSGNIIQAYMSVWLSAKTKIQSCV